MFDLIGYGGPEPLAIIFWYNEMNEGVCKTICYTEEDVMNMNDRHKTNGDLYNTLKPSLQLVGEPYAI